MRTLVILTTGSGDHERDLGGDVGPVLPPVVPFHFSVRSLNMSIAAIAQDSRTIPRSRQNPKILRIDDAKIVRYAVAIGVPLSGHLLAQKRQDRITEVCECRVTSVVSDMLVH